jgi:hypothetical protein
MQGRELFFSIKPIEISVDRVKMAFILSVDTVPLRLMSVSAAFDGSSLHRVIKAKASRHKSMRERTVRFAGREFPSEEEHLQ